MDLEKLNKLMENLLKDGFSEDDLIFAIRSSSAKLALEKWGESVPGGKEIHISN